MKKFKNYEDLLKAIGVWFSSDLTYAKNELNNYLETIGSDYGEPTCLFSLEFNKIKYNIGVTHTEDKEDEDTYILTYWIIDIENLENRKWKDVKDILTKHITVDMTNFDKADGIVDFDGIYSDYSIMGKIEYSKEEMAIKISDDEEIYKNN